MTPPSDSHAPRRGPSRHHAAIAIATALPLVAAPTAIAGIPAGTSVAATQIAGDGFGQDKVGAAVQRAASKANGKRVVADGDGPGPVAFTSPRPTLLGGGVLFEFNSGSSSQSDYAGSDVDGSLNEASFTAPRDDVSTADGGTRTDTLGDAFDGYNVLSVHVGPDAPTATEVTEAIDDGEPTPGVTRYVGSGLGNLTCDNRELRLGTQTIGDLQVSRRVYVPADAPVARTLSVVTNTGATPLTVTLYASNNLGSDSSTRVTGSSSGSLTPTTGDRWVTTFQNFSGSTSSDPRLGHVFAGNGPAPALRSVNFADGDDNPAWDHSLTVAPGATQIVSSFVIVEANKALAASRSAELAARPLTDCMTADEIAQTANFDTTAPTLDLPAPPQATAADASGARVRFQATATDAVSGSVPVTCTPASGSVFPVGTTTVTCTATDASGNTATGTFTVVVAAPPAAPAPPAPPVAPAPPVCVSSRNFTVRIDAKLAKSQRGKIRSSTVTLDGKRLKVTRKSGRQTVQVDLRGRKQSTVRLRIKLRLASGKTVDDVRVYRPCAPTPTV